MAKEITFYSYKIKQIRRVIDGDTFVCDVDLGFGIYKTITVRLLGFDALETRHTRKCERQSKQDCLNEEDSIYIGKQVAKCLEEILLSNGTSNLFLISDKLDSFGRSLARVYKNGVDVAHILDRFQSHLIEEKVKERNICQNPVCLKENENVSDAKENSQNPG